MLANPIRSFIKTQLVTLCVRFSAEHTYPMTRLNRARKPGKSKNFRIRPVKARKLFSTINGKNIADVLVSVLGQWRRGLGHPGLCFFQQHRLVRTKPYSTFSLNFGTRKSRGESGLIKIGYQKIRFCYKPEFLLGFYLE